jgi:hypothetical protein
MRTFPRCFFLAVPVSVLALAACIPTETPDGDVGPDGAIFTDATVPPNMDGARPDALPPEDAGADSPADAPSDSPADAPSDGPADAAPDALVDAATDASVVVQVSPAQCPWGLSVSLTQLYWTENIASPGCSASASVRVCPVGGCATLPAPVYTATAQSIPMGIVFAGGAIFYTDNQVPNNNLWRLASDGSTREIWGDATNRVGPAGAFTDGTSIFWGSSEGLFRTPVSAGKAPAGATRVMDGNLSGTIENGPQSIAGDAKNIYAAPSGSTLYGCPKGGSCDPLVPVPDALVTIANEPDIRAIASDGNHVFFTAGMPGYTPGGKERLLRCPVAGCSKAVPEVLAETSPTADGQGSHHGIVVDETRVYWGTREGVIYSCLKNAAAPCKPAELARGVRPVALAATATHVYWADTRGGIYRAPKL